MTILLGLWSGLVPPGGPLDPRVALVIGNAAYPGSPLVNSP